MFLVILATFPLVTSRKSLQISVAWLNLIKGSPEKDLTAQHQQDSFAKSRRKREVHLNTKNVCKQLYPFGAFQTRKACKSGKKSIIKFVHVLCVL